MFDVDHVRIVQPVYLRVVILRRIDDMPVIVLIDVWVQCNLLLCKYRSDNENDGTEAAYVNCLQGNYGHVNAKSHLGC